MDSWSYKSSFSLVFYSIKFVNMSQASQVSDNEPLKPQELGSKVKVKKPSQKQLFEEAQARKAGAAAVAEWRKKCEAEEEEAAALRREKERAKFMKEAEKAKRTLIVCETSRRKELDDFLPASGDSCSLEHGEKISKKDKDEEGVTAKEYAKAEKKFHNYNAKLNKKDKIDEANAKYLAAWGKERLPGARR